MTTRPAELALEREGSATTIPWGDLLAHPSSGENPAPWKISVRDLSRNVSKVLSRIYEETCPAVVTYRGVPSWVVLPLDQTRLASFLLGNVAQLTDETIRSVDVVQMKKHLEAGDFRTLDQFVKDGSR